MVQELLILELLHSFAIPSPKITELLIKGIGGKGLTIDSTQKLTRYFGQLTSAMVDEGLMGAEDATAIMSEIDGNKSNYDNFFKTGILEGAQGEPRPNPEEAPPIDVNLGRGSNTMNTAVPLPTVTPSDLPISTSAPQDGSNLQLAQTLNLFNKGGIVSAKKNF